jgi:hypothetical protein
VVTSTLDDKKPMENVSITLKRYENNVVKEWRRTYSDQYGWFQFDQLSVDNVNHTDYDWRVFIEYSGYSDIERGPKFLRPGMQWKLGEIEMFPLGNLVGYIKDEDGKLIQALVRLEDGPHIQTTLVSRPNNIPEFCGIVNNFGDAINKASKLFNMIQQDNPLLMQGSLQAAKFSLPAQSGSNKRLVIIPLPEQYFQDTCYLDVENVSQGQIQFLGNITVKEKLHRILFALKGPDGNPVQGKVRVDDYVRQTTPNGWAGFRFASPEINYRVRVDPESPLFVPIDTIIRIPISKEYRYHTFQLREGRKLKVVVIRDQSGQQHQSAQPIPIPGAIVQTLLSASPTGNSYIQCITDQNGTCTLEGVPTGPSTVDVTAWKEDETHLYIGKTVSISTNRPLNPPFEIKLKWLPNVTVADIWGFPTAITDIEIRSGS